MVDERKKSTEIQLTKTFEYSKDTIERILFGGLKFFSALNDEFNSEKLPHILVEYSGVALSVNLHKNARFCGALMLIVA